MAMRQSHPTNLYLLAAFVSRSGSSFCIASASKEEGEYPIFCLSSFFTRFFFRPSRRCARAMLLVPPVSACLLSFQFIKFQLFGVDHPKLSTTLFSCLLAIPLKTVCFYDTASVVQALLLCAVVVVGLTLYTFQTKFDWTVFHGMLVLF